MRSARLAQPAVGKGREVSPAECKISTSLIVLEFSFDTPRSAQLVQQAG